MQRSGGSGQSGSGQICWTLLEEEDLLREDDDLEELLLLELLFTEDLEELLDEVREEDFTELFEEELNTGKGILNLEEEELFFTELLLEENGHDTFGTSISGKEIAVVERSGAAEKADVARRADVMTASVRMYSFIVMERKKGVIKANHYCISKVHFFRMMVLSQSLQISRLQKNQLDVEHFTFGRAALPCKKPWNAQEILRVLQIPNRAV